MIGTSVENGEHLDLLWGAEAIRAALSLKNRRQAFHLLETGAIPAKKVGRTWVASRQKLREHFGVAAAESRA